MAELSGRSIHGYEVTVDVDSTMDNTTETVKPSSELGKVRNELISPNSRQEEFDVQLKRKAQTELARKKMEALRNREGSRHEEDWKAKAVTPPLSSPGPYQAQSVHENSAETLKTTSKSQSILSSSNGVVATTKASTSIPGLFVTLNEQEPLYSNSQSAAQTTTVNPLLWVSPQNQTPPISNEYLQGEVTKVPESTPAGTEIISADVKFPSVDVTTYETRKRQRAADFIDSPPTRARQLLGQNEDTIVIIDVSEDSDDEESISRQVNEASVVDIATNGII